MPKRAAFEIFRQELSLDVSVGVHILLVVEQSSLESQSRGCAKTPIFTVIRVRTTVLLYSSGSYRFISNHATIATYVPAVSRCYQ